MNWKLEARRLQIEYVKLLAQAFEAAGDVKPLQLAKATAAAARNGHSPMSSAASKHAWAMHPSMFSRRLDKLDLNKFQIAINRALEKRAINRLQELRPDAGTLFAIVDGHPEKHYLCHSRNGCKIPRCRCRISMANHVRNVGSNCVMPWLTMVLSWRHRGRIETVDVHWEILSPTEHQPGEQIETMARILHRLVIQPDVFMVDSGFDAPDVRRVADRHGLPLIHRLNIGTNAGRRAHIVLGDQDVTLGGLLDRASRLGPIRTRHGPQAQAQAYRVASWLGRLSGGKAGEIVCVPNLRPVPGASPSRWELDLENSMVLFAPAGTPAMKALISYRYRWRIETRQYEHGQGTSMWRPKRVYSSVVGHLAKVLAKAFVFPLRELMRRNGTKIEGVPAQWITTSHITGHFLDPVVHLPPPVIA